MFYYTLDNKLLISQNKLNEFQEVKKECVVNYSQTVYILKELDPLISNRSFIVTNTNMLFSNKENLNLLINSQNNSSTNDIPQWLINKIEEKNAVSLNIKYPNWINVIKHKSKIKCKVNVVGLGDVGGTLVTGLRLLGGDVIKQIGIFDKDENKMRRWEFETGQILSAESPLNHPAICLLNDENLFDCDMFVFCVSLGVPEVGKEAGDVRLAQFSGNSNILSYYAKKARKLKYDGIFAIVSDPVDLLCKVAFNESNKDEKGQYDFLGLAPEQIRGYGLGVMNARALYYANKTPNAAHYATEGRAFGPHGEGLVIADSMQNYNETLSDYLTEKTKKANLELRSTGFKPYIAPALSSGALSLIATIKNQWNYSATFLGGTFMGSRNRVLPQGLELETYNMPKSLFDKLQITYNYLNSIYY